MSNGAGGCVLGTGSTSMSEWTLTLGSVAESPVLARDA